MPCARQIPLPLKRYAELLDASGLLVSPHVDETPELFIASATCDSREVREGALFVCKGAAFKREYLDNAIKAGAAAYMAEQPFEDAGVCCLQVRDIRRAMATVADVSWGHPSKDVQVCGITGTKGKSTAVYYLKGILDMAAREGGAAKAAFLTGIRYDDGVESGTSNLTTPEPFELQRRIANAREAGLPYLAMEVSSQALKYHRVLGVDFAVGAFTNIGEDHISPYEHPDFEDYFASKLMLFERCRTAAVNADMDCAQRVIATADASCERTVTYSMTPGAADVSLVSATWRDGGFAIEVALPEGSVRTHIPTPALFNVSNALSAIACAVALGIDAETIARGVSGVSVPGRMETRTSADGRIVGVVDYAHNGMSMEALLGNLRERYPEHRIIATFGSAGRKGFDRREAMGRVAGRMADAVILTEDDPWTEDARAICEEIAAAMDTQGFSAYEIITNREEAIHAAFEQAAASAQPCVVAVAGKGHEATIKRAGGPEPWPTDAELVRRELAAYDAQSA